MRVGLVSPYDFASPGGVTDHVRQLARQLRRLDHDVRVFAPSSRADVDFDSAEFYRIGSPISVPVNESVARITLSFHLADRVAAIIEREHFDVLHFHEPLMPALPITMLRMSQAANVGTFHAFAKSNIGYLYGRPLLERNGKETIPTEEGERLLAYARRILALADEARDVVSRPTGTAIVRLGIPEDFAAYRLTELLSDFVRARPGLRRCRGPRRART